MDSFVFPLGGALLAMVIAGLLALLSCRRVAWALAIASVGALWVVSTPMFAILLLSGLEDQYPPDWIENTARADVAIVLGGVSTPSAYRSRPDLSDSVDRVFLAAELFRAGNVDHVLATGGNPTGHENGLPEAVVMGALLEQLGVPEDAIVLETDSRNTHENAAFTKALLANNGWSHALLVTSASHMPRALAVFRHAGVEVTPVAAEYHGYKYADFRLADLAPNAGALSASTRAIKEYVGIIVYRARDWI